MNTLMKLAWKKDLAAAGGGAALGGLAGEIKHRRARARGKDSSRAANIAGGAAGGGALGYGGLKAYQHFAGGGGEGGGEGGGGGQDKPKKPKPKSKKKGGSGPKRKSDRVGGVEKPALSGAADTPSYPYTGGGDDYFDDGPSQEKLRAIGEASFPNRKGGLAGMARGVGYGG